MNSDKETVVIVMTTNNKQEDPKNYGQDSSFNYAIPKPLKKLKKEKKKKKNFFF
jgi:hypothetical protein